MKIMFNKILLVTLFLMYNPYATKAMEILDIIRSNSIHIPLIDAICQNNISDSLFLLKMGPNKKILNMGLMVVSSKGYAEMVSLLINHGADVNYKNKAGAFPLVCSVESGQNECLVLLLKANANIDSIYKKTGFTALINAIELGKKECVQSLLDFGANVNLTENVFNVTALSVAILHNNIPCVLMLLDAGAKILDVDLIFNKYTPLMYAAKRGQLRICEILVEKMLQTPTKSQLERIYFFLWTMKMIGKNLELNGKPGINRNILVIFKTPLLKIISQENSNDPNSRVFKEIHKINRQDIKNHLFRKYRQTTEESNKCSIQ